MKDVNKIAVVVQPHYLEEQSDPDEKQYVFAYHVQISNEGVRGAKLLSRHWIITDSDGKVEEVKGPGVVGETPELAPGESFEYTSGAILTTPLGTMVGTYQMQGDDGTDFEAEIPAFTLSANVVFH